MWLLKESVLQIWKARKAAVRNELAKAERAAKAIQDKLDRLDEALLFERSIDIETYDRHAEKLREELTLARIDLLAGKSRPEMKGWWPRGESNRSIQRTSLTPDNSRH